jgi:flagellar motor switch protein FliN
MTIPSTPYDWIRELPLELKQLDEIPLTGNSPPFPWDQLSARLATSFEREELLIQPGELMWRSKEHLYEGLSDDPFPLNFTIPSLRGEASWVMPEQEMTTLETLLLTKESHPISFQDRSLSESFYRFLALEVLYNLTQVAYDKSLIPILSKKADLFQESALCWDISIRIQTQVIWGRLIISSELRRSWIEHFAQKKSSPLSQKLAKLIEIPIHIEAGKTNLNLQQWMNVQLGDLIMLDHCSLDLATHEGRVLLTVNGQSVFRGKIKDGNLKILELPLLSEVTAPMAKYSPDHDEDEDDLSDLDLTEEDETADDETTDDSSDLDEDLFEEKKESESVQKQEVAPTAASSSNASLQAAISPEKIAVTLIVEAGRIQMTMDKLLKLEPGNLLELDLHPENGVALTINGSVVGKGELLRMGELIGVRILELGK